MSDTEFTIYSLKMFLFGGIAGFALRGILEYYDRRARRSPEERGEG